MFKNPLKYQEGGSVQDAMKQLVAWLVQNTGLDEGQISQRLNQILSDDTAKQELATNLQNMQNGDREAEERIKNMFIPKNAKLGGKIQDFICKHGKGGKAGCGCKKAEGGEIETREKLKPIGMPMQYEGTVYTDRYPASGEQIAMGDTGNPMSIAAYNSYNHFGEGISVPTPQYRAMTRGLIDGSGWGYNGKVLTPSEVSKWLNFNKAVDASNRIQNPQQKSLEMENGGMVQKNALGSDGIGKYSASGRKLKISEVPNMPVDFDPVNVTTETLPTGARRMVFNAVDSNGQAVADTVININGVRYRSPHVTKTWSKNNNSSLTPSESAWYDTNYYFDDAKDDNMLNALEYDNGGKVMMNQNGGADANWFTRMYNRFIGRRVPNTVEATDRRLKTWTDANGVQHIVEDANVNGNSTVTTIDINGADTLGKEKITTGDGRYRMINLQPGTPEWRAVMSRNVQEQENGGLIEAGKKGISRLEAINKAKELYGYNDSQAKFAYANAKNALRNQGLRGRKLKQSAREMISKRERQKIEAVDPNSKVQGFNAPILPDWNNLPKQTIVGDLTPRMTNNYDSLSFSNAFRAARNKAGGDNGVFNWRGGKYTTALKNTNNTTNNTANNTANNVYNIPGLEPVVINNPEIEIPQYEPLQIESISTPPVSEILYPGLRDMIERRASISSSWPILQWMQNQKENSKKIVFGPYGIRNKQPRVLTVSSPALYTPSPMAFKTGGKVEKAQKGEKTNDTPYNGTISQGKPRSKVSQAIDNNSKARNFVKGAKQFAKSPMVKWPLAGALAYGGYHLGLTPTVQSMGEELAPHMAPYLFPFLSQMRPKFILDTMNPMKEPPKVEKPSDVFWTIPSNEKGGKVEKAQGGSVLDYYSNKWSNDLNRIKQGWNRFKESAPGKVWGAFMPKPNSETGMIGAFTPGTTFMARIPKQKPTITISENLGNGKFSAIDDFGRSVLYDAERDKDLFQVIDKNNVLWKPGEDWDIDLPTFNSIDVSEYLKNLGPIINWPKFIGRNVLLPASGVVGSAAAGSYVATKKDKNKKSENK